MSNNFKSVRMVSGSWPPDICGVGDFMANVSKALSQAGVEVVRSTLTRHGFLTAVALMIRSHLRSDETVYISYPTEGYGKSIWPFLLALGSHRRIVLHLHEYGSKNRYCRFLLRRFQNMRRVFFSNAEDFRRFVSDCGLRPDHPSIVQWQVVPTPSNIPITATADHRDLDRLKVVHFGQIRPHKGLEQLTAAFDTLHNEPWLDFVLMGGVPKGYESYAAAISDTFSKSGTQVKLNSSPEEISEVFANAQIGVFPFPDGADERRGSLIAAMAHGVLCVTTHSDRTPDAIKAATIGIEVQPEMVAAQAIAEAIRRAATTISSKENMHRVLLAKSLGANVSFGGIAKLIIND